MDPYVLRTQSWINSEYGSNPDTLDIGPVTENGQTGWQTVTALVRALQYELGITNRSDNFGAGTLAALTAVSPVNNSTSNKNLIRIAQGAMYCKGYPGGDGYVTGRWDADAIGGMKSLRDDIGLSKGNGDIEPKVFKAMLNMDAYKLLSGGTPVVRMIQRSLNARYLHRKDFSVIPAEGRYSGDIQTALIYAIQYELEIADGVANGNVGPTTKSRLGTMAGLSLGSTDTAKWLVHLFQAALVFYGYSVPYDGEFGALTKTAAESFQGFVKLPVTGKGDVQTWCSLIISYGDDDRPGTGADCVTTLTPARVANLRSEGYLYFGRYLTNTPDNEPDKCIQKGELQRIFTAGGRVFPLFQTGGGSIEHFTADRGREVGEEAASAAWAYRIPANTIIYFSVDFDATHSQVTNQVIPYFQALPERLGRMGRKYRIGVYAPRRVCHQLNEAGVVVSTFVSDMSALYGSNKAQRLPANWAFDQIQTKWEGSGASLVEIDKNISSGSNTGFASLTPSWGVGDDPEVDQSAFGDMFEEMFRDTYEHEGSIQRGYNNANKGNVRGNVLALDPYITQLAADFNCYKALILTPMVHEGLCRNDADTVKDLAVRAYYLALETGADDDPDNDSRDSSTGLCQIFASTAVKAHNFALEKGLITGRKYSSSVWQDMWEMWKALQEHEFNLKMAMFTMMMEASNDMGIDPGQTKSMTPSQVMRTCALYNGTNEGAMIYGRNRMSQYYTICKWEESFR